MSVGIRPVLAVPSFISLLSRGTCSTNVAQHVKYLAARIGTNGIIYSLQICTALLHSLAQCGQCGQCERFEGYIWEGVEQHIAKDFQRQGRVRGGASHRRCDETERQTPMTSPNSVASFAGGSGSHPLNSGRLPVCPSSLAAPVHVQFPYVGRRRESLRERPDQRFDDDHLSAASQTVWITEQIEACNPISSRCRFCVTC